MNATSAAQADGANAILTGLSTNAVYAISRRLGALGIWWSRLHLAVMLGGTGVLSVIGWLAVFLYTPAPHLQTWHQRAGVAVQGVLVIQVLLGFVSNAVWTPSGVAATWWELAHKWVGRLVAVTAVATTYSGIDAYDRRLGGVRPLWRVVFWMWIDVCVVVLAFGEFKYGLGRTKARSSLPSVGKNVVSEGIGSEVPDLEAQMAVRPAPAKRLEEPFDMSGWPSQAGQTGDSLHRKSTMLSDSRSVYTLDSYYGLGHKSGTLSSSRSQRKGEGRPIRTALLFINQVDEIRIAANGRLSDVRCLETERLPRSRDDPTTIALLNGVAFVLAIATLVASLLFRRNNALAADIAVTAFGSMEVFLTLYSAGCLASFFALSFSAILTTTAFVYRTLITLSEVLIYIGILCYLHLALRASPVQTAKDQSFRRHGLPWLAVPAVLAAAVVVLAPVAKSVSPSLASSTAFSFGTVVAFDALRFVAELVVGVALACAAHWQDAVLVEAEVARLRSGGRRGSGGSKFAFCRPRRESD
ncbi:hypothetical protein DFJ73DRAFT_915216 [Zopfochytrium polystomum]|nr:hypothetical protein DFJ73DRAFT_915216 [Zopfochytrium polystomum]